MDQKNKHGAVASDSKIEARRRSVKTILGAGGVVAGGHLAGGAWVKPVVDSVVLPAHAATSQTGIAFDDSLEDPCFITLTCTGLNSFDVQVDGAVVPATSDVNVEIEIAFNGSESFESFATTTTDANGEYQATNSYGPPANTSSIQVSVTLPDYPEAGAAECSIDTTDSESLNPGNSYSTLPGGTYFCTYYVPSF